MSKSPFSKFFKKDEEKPEEPTACKEESSEDECDGDCENCKRTPIAPLLAKLEKSRTFRDINRDPIKIEGSDQVWDVDWDNVLRHLNTFVGYVNYEQTGEHIPPWGPRPAINTPRFGYEHLLERYFKENFGVPVPDPETAKKVIDKTIERLMDGNFLYAYKIEVANYFGDAPKMFDAIVAWKATMDQEPPTRQELSELVARLHPRSNLSALRYLLKEDYESIAKSNEGPYRLDIFFRYLLMYCLEERVNGIKEYFIEPEDIYLRLCDILGVDPWQAPRWFRQQFLTSLAELDNVKAVVKTTEFCSDGVTPMITRGSEFYTLLPQYFEFLWEHGAGEIENGKRVIVTAVEAKNAETEKKNND